MKLIKIQYLILPFGTFQKYRNAIIALIFVCCNSIIYSNDLPWKTAVLRDQDPRVVAKYRLMPASSCFHEVVFEVSLSGRQQVIVNSEVCMNLDDAQKLSSQIGWSSPLLSIKETCNGNSITCEANRALIIVNRDNAKRIGTFTDYINLKDQKLILSLLSWSPTEFFLSNAEYHLIRYVNTLEGDKLVFSPELTWVLNHEEFFRYFLHVTNCGPGRFDCKVLRFNSASLKTALLFTAQVASITGRASYLNTVKYRAAELLSSSENAAFLRVVSENPKLR